MCTVFFLPSPSLSGITVGNSRSDKVGKYAPGLACVLLKRFILYENVMSFIGSKSIVRLG